MKNVTGKIICLLAVQNLVICLLVALVLMGTALGDIPRNGLVAEWRFEDIGKDSSGKGNDYIIYGAIPVDGKFGKALSYNGIDNYITAGRISQITNDSDWTVSFWMKSESVSSYRNPFDANFADGPNNAGNQGPRFEQDSTGNFGVVVGTNISNYAGYGYDKIAVGIWYHVVGIRNGNTIQIYLNNIKKNDQNNNLWPPGFNNVNVGRGFSISPERWYKGSVDEVLIFNRALTANEVKSIYEAGQIIITSSPTGAEVLIDGQSRGNAFPTMSLYGISAGQHAVQCSLPGYQDYTINVVLPTSSVFTFNCALNPAPTPTTTPTTTPTIIGTTPAQTTSAPSNIGMQSNTTALPIASATPPMAVRSALITGKITDAKTGEPARDATVNIEGKSATTDANGEYDLTVEVGKHSLSVNKEGYETVKRSILVPEGGTMLDLSLKPASGNESWSWIFIILFIIAVATGIIYLIYRKNNKKVEGKKKENVESKKGTVVEKKKFCMFCHAPIALDSDYCNKCGKKQDETKRFCMSCGALMPSVPELCGKCSMMPPSGDDTKNCRNCGEVIPVVAKFCSACGAGQPE